MKRLTLTVLLGLIALSGCTGCQKPEIAGEPTNYYQKYVEQFNKDLMKLGYMPIDTSKLSIRSANELKVSDKGYLGYCYEIAVKPKLGSNISIHKIVETYGEDIQMALIYHELGHCFLGLKDSDGHKIMNNENLRTLFTYAEMMEEAKRLQLVKQMLESSSYR